MKRDLLVILFILMVVVKVNAGTCVKDLNGDGGIDPQTEKWSCLSTNPSLCPQNIVHCTINDIGLFGSTSTTQTNVTDKMGITKISADAQGGSLIIEGWSCGSIACSQTSIGSIKVRNATVSGTVAADKISRMVGQGSAIQIFGCDGSTSCTEALLGTITMEGAEITGSAAADAGLISMAGSDSTLSVQGMTCNDTGCLPITAGILSIKGARASCPLGSQYPCVNVNGVQQCSDLTCNDDTFGGRVSPGQQICVKDINSDGVIDFSTEMAVCREYNSQYYCPLLAQDCSLQISPPACPSGGAIQTGGKDCMATVNNNTCPTGYDLQSDNTCTAAATCSQGTLNTDTLQCEIGYACPLGSSYSCFPNAAKSDTLQCNTLSCFDGSIQNLVTGRPETSSYQNDGSKDASGKCLGTILIFNGKPLECRPPGISTNFFDCCDQAEDSFLMVKKMCGEPDTECVAKTGKGSCHLIGSYCKENWWLIGCVQSANVFCCFSSMLARIIQEQGRPQLQSFNGWGTVEAPDCRGFTKDEFSHLDFTKIDLSEYINATKTAMESKVQNIQNKMRQQFKTNIQNKTP